MKNNNLIKSFYEKYKEDINLPYDKVKTICESPFKIMKQKINNGELHDFSLLFLGKFLCNDSRLGYYTKSLEEKYKKGLITEEQYNKVLENEKYQKELREDYVYIKKYNKLLRRKS